MGMKQTDNIYGNPTEQVPYWEMQSEPDNCSVVAEMMVIKQFGVDIDQKDANFISSLYGWYSMGSGTAFLDIGQLMTKYGISNHMNIGVSWEELRNDIINEVVAGHGIIVGIRSPHSKGAAEVPPSAAGYIGQARVNHAVVLTGIDVTDPHMPKAIVNDPGEADGAGKVWLLDDLIEACWNGCRFYVATDEPLPSSLHEPSSVVGDIRKVYDLLMCKGSSDLHSSRFSKSSYIENIFSDNVLIDLI